MSTNRSTVVVASLAWLALAPAVRAEKTLSYADLVHRMTDLSRLAVLPAPGEKCAQWSSYDRASKYDEKTGKYVHWDANGDGGGIIRTRRRSGRDGRNERPRAASGGSGRRHREGTRQDLSGRPAEPAVDLPFADYFDGKHAPFNYPALSYNLGEVHSSGQNLYLPIPYQKSCKIVADKGWGNYFHFNYATYPAGTDLPTFSTALAAQHADQLKSGQRLLRQAAGQRSGRKAARPRDADAVGRTWRPARRPAWRRSTAPGRSPPCG